MTGLTFDADTHTYRLDDQVVPSVTGILRASGLIDFGGIPERTLADARERGTAVHRAIHYYNESDLDVAWFRRTFPAYAGYLNAWMLFREQRHFVPLMNERRIASRRYRFAGTLDCLGLLDGALVLVDFKSGNPQDVAADLQTAAYEALAREWSSEDEPLARLLAQHPRLTRLGVQLKKDGTFKVETYKDPRQWTEFAALVTAYHIIAARKAGAVSWLEGAA